MDSQGAAQGDGSDALRAELGLALGGVQVLGFFQLPLPSACLLRERPDGGILVAHVDANPSNETGFVATRPVRADSHLPEIRSACPRCDRELRQWTLYCIHCGAVLDGIAVFRDRTRNELLSLIRHEAKGKYEVLGEVDRPGGSVLCFVAREHESGTLVGLTLEEEPLPLHRRLHGERRGQSRGAASGDRRERERRHRKVVRDAERRNDALPELIIKRVKLTHLAPASG